MANRIYEGNLYKQLSLEDLRKPGGVMVADHLKLETELRQIFTAISHADPNTAAGTADGNFANVVIRVTTPSAVDVELAVPHNLGRLPVGWHIIVPAVSGYRMLGSLYNKRDPDTTNLYLAVSLASEVSKTCSLTIW